MSRSETTPEKTPPQKESVVSGASPEDLLKEVVPYYLENDLLLLKDLARAVAKDFAGADLSSGRICLGEFHKHESPKKWLLKNLRQLVLEGESWALAVEHLAPNEDYSCERSGNIGEDGKLIEGSPLYEKLKDLDDGHMSGGGWSYGGSLGFSAVVEEAFRIGMKVVPLEISDAEYHRYPEGGAARMIQLNLNALKVIQREEVKFANENEGKQLKWIAFVGSAHLHTCFGVPGICDIIPGVTSLIVSDLNLEGGEQNEVLKVAEDGLLDLEEVRASFVKTPGSAAATPLRNKAHAAIVVFSEPGSESLGLPEIQKSCSLSGRKKAVKGSSSANNWWGDVDLSTRLQSASITPSAAKTAVKKSSSVKDDDWYLSDFEEREEGASAEKAGRFSGWEDSDSEENSVKASKTKESVPVRSGGFLDEGADDLAPPAKKMPSVKFSPTSGDPSKKTTTETEI